MKLHPLLLLLAAASAGHLGTLEEPVVSTPGRLPNFVLIVADDLGYGDLEPYGSQLHRTPSLQRMADEGLRLTSFYATSGVCTPTRASILTASYPRRIGIHQSYEGELTLHPAAHRGLAPDEVTLAEVLAERGYATGIVGKWHLGDQPVFLPTRQGFDSWFGPPYSNDMGLEGYLWRASRRPEGEPPEPGYHPLPLMRGERVVETEPDQGLLTRRYTEEAIQFFEEHRDEPFFLYLPHTMPHQPVHASEAFAGRSANGTYGDVIEELDWSTGEILAALERLGLEERTLVIFTSDNGANLFGGSNAPLRGFKTSTWEGGMRVPFLARWPDVIPAGAVSDEIVTVMDLLPTFARVAGATPPRGRALDGRDVWPILAGEPGARSPHDSFYYYFKGSLEGVRSGKWKLSFGHADPWSVRQGDFGLALYDLDADVGETRDVAAEHPDVVERLTALAQRARRDLGDDATGRPGTRTRPPGFVADPKALTPLTTVEESTEAAQSGLPPGPPRH